MPTRAIVNVATTPFYKRGQNRLVNSFHESVITNRDYALPHGSPKHDDVPYAFKAYALKEAAQHNDLLLWCDACIVPGPRKLEELWAKIERDGYWFCRNGYENYTWTAESAYPELFPGTPIHMAREINRRIPHVVATAFGLNLKADNGREFLDEYFRLASQTHAFCGPWINSFSTPAEPSPRTAICGPQDVRGHRHDQTAASVIAWRLSMKLDDPPEWFAYKGGENERTALVADGAY